MRVLIFASHAAWERCSTEMDSAINSSTPRLWVNPYRGWSAASGDDGHTSPATAFYTAQAGPPVTPGQRAPNGSLFDLTAALTNIVLGQPAYG